jgi:hypothetical protein
MGKVFRIAAGVVLAAGLLSVGQAHAQEVWLADLKVEMTTTENAAAGTLLHEITVTNKQDDTGRDILITHIPVIGMGILAFTSQRSVCVLRPVSSIAIAVQCSLSTLNPGLTEKVWVVTRNTTTWTGGKVTTAQVMGLSPDREGEDNVVSITFP